MNKSESIKELAAALSKFQSEVAAVAKDSENPFFKSRFSSLGEIKEAIKTPLAKNGLAVSQFPDGDGLTSVLTHASGEWMEATMKLTPKDETPQGQGSALTYARRYSLSAILGIVSETDDDGEAAQPKSPQKPAQAFPTSKRQSTEELFAK